MDSTLVRAVPSTHPDVVELVAEVQQEYVVRYGTPDDTALEEGIFNSPAGAFFVGTSRYLGKPL